MENRVMVYSASYEHEAIIVQDKLRAEGIDTLMLDQKDSVSEIAGGFELYVHPEDEEKALAIVKASAG